MKRNKGFSLTEILIGAAILSVMLGGLYSLFTGVSKTGKSLEGHSKIQRIAFMICKKLRNDIWNAESITQTSTPVSINLKSSDKSGNSIDVKWIFDQNSKKISRVVDGGVEDFSSKGFVKLVEFFIHDDTTSTPYSGSTNKALLSGRLVVDLGLNLIYKREYGFFQRLYSRIKAKGQL